MLLPFLHRHIELKAPEVLLLVGSAAVRTLLQTGDGHHPDARALARLARACR